MRSSIALSGALEHPGALVLEKRRAAGLTQRQLAHRSGISRSCLQAIERRRTRNPKTGTLLHLLWGCEP